MVKLDLPQREGEGLLPPGVAGPEASVVALCLRRASPPRRDKSLVSARTHGHLGVQEIAQQMRRWVGPTDSLWDKMFCPWAPIARKVWEAV